jgi:hypothetical protein
MGSKLTVLDLKKLARKTDADGIVVLVFNNLISEGTFHFGSWGRTERECIMMGIVGEKISRRIEIGDIHP